MKTVLGALALLIAAPVAAQEAPAPDAHADHSQHQQQRTQPQHEGHASDEHKMDCCKDCCAEANKDGKMSCCAKHGEGAAEGAADHSQHAG